MGATCIPPAKWVPLQALKSSARSVKLSPSAVISKVTGLRCIRLWNMPSM